MTRSLAKTATFAAVHFSVAFSIAWALTGSVTIAGVLALVEPVANTIAYFAHERVWERCRRPAASTERAAAAARVAGISAA